MNKYALLSVFDKTGIVEFAKTLTKLGYSIISTGGTAKILQENNIPVIPIQEITGNPESFDGRMKTISFAVESGILFDRSNPSHRKQAKELGIKPIDVVVCNLYPFEQEQTIENIDVGGPTMIRAAGKNFKNVVVVVDPNDYERVGAMLQHHSGPSFVILANRVRPESPTDSGVATLPRMTILELRQKLAAKAFAHLSFYDSQIANYLEDEQFPNEVTLAGRKIIDLRYGENPHQKGAVYMLPNTKSPLKNLKKLWGRELSLVNITDINAGISSIRFFDPKKEKAAVVIKHNNPCGIALGNTTREALKRAIDADPESAFGGVMVLNDKIDLKTAKVIADFKEEKKSNVDILAAPFVDDNALSFLSKIRKTMGIYTFGKIPKNIPDIDIKFIDGGFILQTYDDVLNGLNDWKVVTEKKPTKKQLEQMQLAWKFISRIRSNAVIVVDKELPMTRGIGTGQTSRIRSTKIALEQSSDYVKGAILASDSFYPFDDGVKLAESHGIGAIVQQGGSINDQMSITAATKAGIPMIFTGRRAFWH